MKNSSFLSLNQVTKMRLNLNCKKVVIVAILKKKLFMLR